MFYKIRNPCADKKLCEFQCNNIFQKMLFLVFQNRIRCRFFCHNPRAIRLSITLENSILVINTLLFNDAIACSTIISRATRFQCRSNSRIFGFSTLDETRRVIVFRKFPYNNFMCNTQTFRISLTREDKKVG